MTSSQANFNGKTYNGSAPSSFLRHPAPVGSYPANAFGLHDMHGNAHEWCADWYYAEAYRSPTVVDPKGPSFGSTRVLRGGSWSGDPRFLRSAVRDKVPPSFSSRDVGFRVARSSR